MRRRERRVSGIRNADKVRHRERTTMRSRLNISPYVFSKDLPGGADALQARPKEPATWGVEKSGGAGDFWGPDPSPCMLWEGRGQCGQYPNTHQNSNCSLFIQTCQQFTFYLQFTNQPPVFVMGAEDLGELSSDPEHFQQLENYVTQNFSRKIVKVKNNFQRP